MKRRNSVIMQVRNVLFTVLAMTSIVVQAGPSGQALSFTCAGCHGTDGSSVGPSMPAIAGMDPEVFIDAMKAYREDKRNPTIMNRMARAYTDKEFKEMAWFFASQRLKVYPQKHDTSMASKGAKLHEKYCEKCHENGGRPSDAGTLAGQWMPYLEYTMEDFLTGKRDYPRKMRRKVDAVMKDEGKDAVPALIHYYGSQK